MRSMLDKLTREDFAGSLGTAFRLENSPGESIELTLAEANDLALPLDPATPGPRRRPFSLLFRGPRSPVLPQRIYPLEHPQLGRLEIFLVPVRADAGGVEYEAIFN